MTNVVDDFETGTIPVSEECTPDGITKCEEYDLYECQNGKWVLIEENSETCGYIPLPCEGYTTQSDCEAADCYWYDDACHSSPDWMQYLPLILIGGGITLVVAAVVIPKAKSKQ